LVNIKYFITFFEFLVIILRNERINLFASAKSLATSTEFPGIKGGSLSPEAEDGGKVENNVGGVVGVGNNVGSGGGGGSVGNVGSQGKSCCNEGVVEEIGNEAGGVK